MCGATFPGPGEPLVFVSSLMAVSLLVAVSPLVAVFSLVSVSLPVAVSPLVAVSLPAPAASPSHEERGAEGEQRGQSCGLG